MGSARIFSLKVNALILSVLFPPPKINILGAARKPTMQEQKSVAQFKSSSKLNFSGLPITISQCHTVTRRPETRPESSDPAHHPVHTTVLTRDTAGARGQVPGCPHLRPSLRLPYLRDQSSAICPTHKPPLAHHRPVVLL